MGDTCLDLPCLPAPSTRAEGSPSLGLEAQGALGWGPVPLQQPRLWPPSLELSSQFFQQAWPQDREWAQGAPYLPGPGAGSPSLRAPIPAPPSAPLTSAA